MRAMPSSPRCKVCCAPFGGVGAPVFRLAGFSRSRKNPDFCNWCFEAAPHGGVEMEIGVMFADMRGFTSRSETMMPAAAAAMANRFYAQATDVLVRHVAIIDKMEGDAVMALFIPRFMDGDYRGVMVDAAEDLQAAVEGDSETSCPLGIGLDAGTAFVGNVGAGAVKDFTAIGDVVNTASRLQGLAAAGQIAMSEHVFAAVRDRYPKAAPQDVQLRGKAESMRAYVVDHRARDSARA
jgi:adenylate cyclase